MSRSLLAITLLLAPTIALPQTARITIDTATDLGAVNKNVLGTNISVHLPEYYMLNLMPQGKMQDLRPTVVRWPGGNAACEYNWKIDGDFRDTLGAEYGLNIVDIAQVCETIGAELLIVANFGTMNAEDAADFVEFCNGPVTSEWGHVRDSLGIPEPLNVQYWEIGNALYDEEMWHYCWTAQDPRKYYFGGSEERRGSLSPFPAFPAAKGGLLVSDGSPNQRIVIRFPDVVEGSDTLWVGPDTSSLEPWTRIENLGEVQEGNYYQMDYENDVVTLGNGRHGNIPESGHIVLCEYTTTNHDGYVDFADAMKSVDPTIRIGICLDPDPTWSQDTIETVLDRIDFYSMHQYRQEDTTFPGEYLQRIRAPTRYLRLAHEKRKAIDEWAGPHAEGIGLAITEWNWMLWRHTRATPLANVSLANALVSAEVLGRLSTEADSLHLVVANHFCAATAWDLGYLALISHEYTRRPAFYAFMFFNDYFGERLVHREVETDWYVAGNDTVPLVTAFTSTSLSGDTLHLIAINKHDTLDYETEIEISGFEPDSIAFVYTLNGDSVYATNEEDSANITIQDTLITYASENFTYTLPAHSLTAIAFLNRHMGEDSITSYQLQQNAPNPFASSTTFDYAIPEPGPVELRAYNLLGQRVKTFHNGGMQPGRYTMTWDGRGDDGIKVASGVYFIVLRAGDLVVAKKVLLVR